jgi:hypothetical protein
MPNKNRKSKNNKGRARRPITVRVPFHALQLVTLSGTTFSQVVGPYSGLSDRLSSIADVYDEYRCVALKYRVRWNLTSVNTSAAMAYYPGVTTTTPTTIATIGENPLVSLRAPDDDVLLPYIRVPRGLLAGEQPWYKCQKGTLTADDSVPGQLIFTGNGATDSDYFEVDGIFEFRGEADPANTPLDPKHLSKKIDLLNKRVVLYGQMVNSERDKLLRLLNYTEKSVATPQITRWPPSAK